MSNATDTAADTATGRFIWHEMISREPGVSLAFYAGLLGWTSRQQQFGTFSYSILQANGNDLGGLLPSNSEASFWMHNVVVPDVDAALARAVEAGGVATSEPMDIEGVGRVATLQDPFGARLGIITPKPCEGQEGCCGDPMALGRVGWNELVCADVDAQHAFYAKVIGWNATEIDMGAGSCPIFAAGEAPVANLKLTPCPDKTSLWMPYFLVADVDAAYAKLESLGGKTCYEPSDIPPGRIAVGFDPMGVPFGLFAPNGDMSDCGK